ncbi:hypothetical protein [Paenibacillus sp. MMO-177]|uniref:hypothetical protein n=1 Tax=Paenibacillus sp. MMO-177 TaxID=3081289 RepID=UPI00301A3073
MWKAKIAVIVLILLLTAACAERELKNDTPMEAAETFMSSAIAGDITANAKINHSDDMDFPPQYIIDLANEYDIVDRKPKEIFLGVSSDNARVIIATWKDNNGEEQVWNLKFNKEKDGYYFRSVDIE